MNRSWTRSLHLPLWGVAVWLLLAGCSDSGSARTAVTPTPLASPVRLSGGSPSYLLVSDYAQSAVLKVDRASLEVIGQIRVSGKPTGLAWEGSEVFVGNETTGNVEVYDLNSGAYLRKMGNAEHLFGLPNGIGIDPVAGTVYVVDSVARVVRQFLLDGSSAGPDIGSGQLSGPTALTVDAARERLYISDYGAPTEPFGDTPSIQVFDFYGNRLARIEGATLDFDRPQGLALNGSGKLFVTEALSGTVLVFDVSDLASISKLATLGSGDLHMPLDVWIDPLSSDLYVTSSLSAQIVLIPGGGA